MSEKYIHNIVFGLLATLTFMLAIGFVTFSIEHLTFNIRNFIIVLVLYFGTKYYRLKYIK